MSNLLLSSPQVSLAQIGGGADSPHNTNTFYTRQWNEGQISPLPPNFLTQGESSYT